MVTDRGTVFVELKELFEKNIYLFIEAKGQTFGSKLNIKYDVVTTGPLVRPRKTQAAAADFCRNLN